MRKVRTGVFSVVCVFASLASLATLASCRSPLGAAGDGGTGTLTLRLPGSRASGAASRGPLTGYLDEVTTWVIEGVGPGGRTEEWTFEVASLPVGNEVSISMAIGTWDLGIYGRDAFGGDIFYQSGTVTVAGGVEAELPVTMGWAPGGLLGRLDFDAGTINGKAGLLTATETDGYSELSAANAPSAGLQSSGYYASFAPAEGTCAIDLNYGGAGLNLGGRFTIALWIRADSAGTSPYCQTIVSTQPEEPATYPETDGFSLIINSYGTTDGTLILATSDGATSAICSSGVGVVTTGTWQHVALVVDAEAATPSARVYVNGTLAMTASGAEFADAFSKDLILRLGALPFGSYWYSGRMDDVRVYGGALSAEAIAAVIGQGAFGGGSGTTASPYLVSDAHQLNNVRCVPGATYSQTADVSLGAGTDFAEWTPIGTTATPFSGTYDGGGRAILGLAMSAGSQYRGLFGYANGAALRRLNLTDPAITGAGEYSGALAGFVNGCAISFISATGLSVTGAADTANIGGLVGYAASTGIESTSASGTVSVENGFQVGGLLGTAAGNVTILSSSFTGTVAGQRRLGGAVGLAADSAFQSVRFEGTVSGLGNNVGGLIGEASGENTVLTIIGCSSSGTVTASEGEGVGGLAGYAFACDLSDSHSTCAVSGLSRVGGLVGYSEGTGMTRVYFAFDAGTAGSGSVTGTGRQIGGLVGYASGSLVSSSHADGVTIVGPAATLGLDGTGGFAGYVAGDTSITECKASGTVTTSGSTCFVGGFAGLVEGEGASISRCCASVAVSHDSSDGWYFGGFVGYFNAGTITQCYASGTVTGNQRIGGFVGAVGPSLPALSYCYSSGEPALASAASGLTVGGFSGDYSFEQASWPEADHGELYWLADATEDGLDSNAQETNFAVRDENLDSGGFLANRGWDSGIWAETAAFPRLRWELD